MWYYRIDYINLYGEISMIEHVKPSDPKFIDVLERFKKELNDFTDYSNLRSKLSGNVKKNLIKLSLIGITQLELLQNSKILTKKKLVI